MGNQQLLIIVLGVIIVAVAIVVGIALFRESAEQSNRDAVTTDVGYLAGDLVAAYKIPLLTGGAGGDFRNIYSTDPVKTLKKKKKSGPKTSTAYYWETEDGTYTLVTVEKDSVVVLGTGRETGIDRKNPVRVRGYVRADGYRVEIVN